MILIWTWYLIDAPALSYPAFIITMSSFAFNVQGPTSGMMLDFSLDEITKQNKKMIKKNAPAKKKKAAPKKKVAPKKKTKRAKPGASKKRALGKKGNKAASKARTSTKAAAAKAKAVAKVSGVL